MKPRVQFSVDENIPDKRRAKLIERVSAINGVESVLQINPKARSAWARSLYVLVMGDDTRAEKAAHQLQAIDGVLVCSVDRQRIKAPAAS